MGLSAQTNSGHCPSGPDGLWMAARIDTEYGDGCRARRRLAISLDFLPSRPPKSAAAARRACQGWPRLRAHPKGLALTGPSTAAPSIGSGLEAAGNCAGL